MKKIINIYLASPRGFCAGVKRAIEIVELALQKYGPPIYVRHEIVHNKRVVQELSKKGAVFVEELEEIPLGSRVIFSAHGVSKKIKKVAKDYKHLTLDATCPLVSKVHKQTEKYFVKMIARAAEQVMYIRNREKCENVQFYSSSKHLNMFCDQGPECNVLSVKNSNKNLPKKRHQCQAYLAEINLLLPNLINL